MSEPIKRKRPHLIGVRLSDDEHATLSKYAEAVEITPAAYLRLQALDSPPPRASRKPSINRELTARLIAELGKIGSNVNQIARVLNTRGDVQSDQIEAALSDLHDIRALAFQAMGRKP